MTYIWQKLYRAFTARSLTRNLWEIGVFRNPWTLGAVALSFSLAMFFIYVPGVNTAMGLGWLPLWLMGVTALVGLAPPLFEEITKLFVKSAKDT
jgi:Ca2+-transporting ATPase